MKQIFTFLLLLSVMAWSGTASATGYHHDSSHQYCNSYYGSRIAPDARYWGRGESRSYTVSGRKYFYQHTEDRPAFYYRPIVKHGDVYISLPYMFFDR